MEVSIHMDLLPLHPMGQMEFIVWHVIRVFIMWMDKVMPDYAKVRLHIAVQ